MWTTLALMSALSWTPAADGGQLEVKNARFTAGIFGQDRKSNEFLPGDMVVLSFDIEGLKTTDNGTAEYSIGWSLIDKKGKAVVEKAPQQMSVTCTQGGSRLPTFLLSEILPDTEPGEYTMKLTVEDTRAKAKAGLERKFVVKPLAFGIIRPGLIYISLKEEQAGAAPLFAPPLAVPGQSLMVNFSVTGYRTQGDKEKVNLGVEMKILDESGQPVLKKPFSGEATTLDDDLKKLGYIPFQLPIQLTRGGNYKVVVTATDKIARKTETLTLDLKVIEIK